jgi:hypothetical protein
MHTKAEIGTEDEEKDEKRFKLENFALIIQ